MRIVASRVPAVFIAGTYPHRKRCSSSYSLTPQHAHRRFASARCIYRGYLSASQAMLLRARSRNRTCGLLLRRQTLYPLSYAGKNVNA